MRLNRFLAQAGVCARRAADELIVAGQVKVNGQVVQTLGYRVQPGEQVVYQGKVLLAERLMYVLLNKPKDFITTLTDPKGRKTVMQLVEKACKERIYPVGRLDRATTGLLLFTNDGQLAKHLAHPAQEVEKVYQVTLDKAITAADIDRVAAGVTLEDGPAVVDEVAVLQGDRQSVGLTLHSGRNRIVRRIFEHLGYEVVKLDRVLYGPLTKKNLPRGQFRHLHPREVAQLQQLTGAKSRIAKKGQRRS